MFFFVRYHGGDRSISLESGVKHSLTNQGSVLTLHSVTRAASGEYLCRASNGVGPDATDKVKKYYKPMNAKGIIKAGR